MAQTRICCVHSEWFPCILVVTCYWVCNKHSIPDPLKNSTMESSPPVSPLISSVTSPKKRPHRCKPVPIFCCKNNSRNINTVGLVQQIVQHKPCIWYGTNKDVYVFGFRSLSFCISTEQVLHDQIQMQTVFTSYNSLNMHSYIFSITKTINIIWSKLLFSMIQGMPIDSNNRIGCNVFQAGSVRLWIRLSNELIDFRFRVD